MKRLLFLLLISTFFEKGLTNMFQYDCALSVELDPLKYIIVTRSVEIKIRLNSNCMSLRDF